MSRDRQRPPPTRDLDSPEEVAEMVRRFYADVAQDDLLGPVFEDVAGVDWGEHLPKLTAFWCRALLGIQGYAGNPFRAHAQVHARRPFTSDHFARWLELFHDTVETGWVGPRAARALALAHHVARVHAAQLVGEPSPSAAPPAQGSGGREGVGGDAVSAPPATRPDLSTRTEIHHLVTAFYREVVFDDLLEPMFGEVSEVDWAEHIPRLIDYWCWILLGDEPYRGAVTRTHRHLHGLRAVEPAHCDRWYALWSACIDERWAGPQAEHAKRHARTLMAGMARRVFGFDWAPSARVGVR